MCTGSRAFCPFTSSCSENVSLHFVLALCVVGTLRDALECGNTPQE